MVRGLLIAVASLVAEHGLQARELQKLWLAGLVAPWRVGSSRTRARTRVPCIGRRILNHCATREARKVVFKSMLSPQSPSKNINPVNPLAFRKIKTDNFQRHPVSVTQEEWRY